MPGVMPSSHNTVKKAQLKSTQNQTANEYTSKICIMVVAVVAVVAVVVVVVVAT